MLTYLDTNAWSEVTEPGRDALRNSFEAAAANGVIRPVTSVAVLEELAGLGVKDKAAYLRVVSFMKPLVTNRVLRHISDLTRLEILSGRPLTETERYMNHQERMALWSVARRPATSMSNVAKKVKDEIAQFKVDDEQRRTDVLAMTGATRGQAMAENRKWWADKEHHIQEWVRDYLRDNKAKLNLPDDESKWPTPDDLPALRNIYAFSLARIRFTVGDGRKIKASDSYDVAHYSYAAYADLLVTTDGPFREICDLIRRADLIVESLDEFEVRLAASPTPRVPAGN